MTLKPRKLVQKQSWGGVVGRMVEVDWSWAMKTLRDQVTFVV